MFKVMVHDKKYGYTYNIRTFDTREEAQEHVDFLYAHCEAVWCEDHKNWIEEE